MTERLILTTVGTSAVNREKLDSLYLWSTWQNIKRGLSRIRNNEHHQWLMQEPLAGIRSFIETYIDFLSGLDIDEEKEKPKNDDINVFSAEMTSLHVLKAEREDQVILLLSDSPEGVVCGLLVKSYLERLPIQAVLKIISGLQVENLAEFYRGGLQNFFEIIKEYHSPKKECILNLTGGFKSLVPFATYIAFSLNSKLFLTYEERPEPILIDTNRWESEIKTLIAPAQQALLQKRPFLQGPIVDDQSW